MRITRSGLRFCEVLLPDRDGNAGMMLRAIVERIPIGIDDRWAWVGELRDLDDRPVAVQAGPGDPSTSIILVAFGDGGDVRLLADLERLARRSHHIRSRR